MLPRKSINFARLAAHKGEGLKSNSRKKATPATLRVAMRARATRSVAGWVFAALGGIFHPSLLALRKSTKQETAGSGASTRGVIRPTERFQRSPLKGMTFTPGYARQ
jgi:hypothetical protein